MVMEMKRQESEKIIKDAKEKGRDVVLIKVKNAGDEVKERDDVEVITIDREDIQENKPKQRL